MNGANSALLRALEISHELLAVADQADLHTLAVLDAERLRLLQSARSQRDDLNADDRRALLEISQLNDRAIGLMEHHRRSKERALDTAKIGRRAVTAYSNTRAHR